MGRRFPREMVGPEQPPAPGEFNQYEIYWHKGTHTWTKPAGLEGTEILVHVWGAGGRGAVGQENSATGVDQCRGGGGGGYSMKRIDLSSLNATETITIGAGGTDATATAGSSSFGAHC